MIISCKSNTLSSGHVVAHSSGNLIPLSPTEISLIKFLIVNLVM